MSSVRLLADSDGNVLIAGSTLATVEWIVRMPYFTGPSSVDATDAAQLGWSSTGWAVSVSSTEYNARAPEGVVFQNLPNTTVAWFTDKVAPSWLRIQYPIPVVLRSYEFMWSTASRYGSVWNKPPYDWEIQGSSNNSAWTSVQTYAKSDWVSFTSYMFTVTNPVAFRYWRMLVTTGQGVDITKMRMYVTRPT